MSFSKELFINDLRYSAWANQSLLDGCKTLSPTELKRDLRISHTNILATLNHICDAEKVWLDCLQSATPDGVWPQPTKPSSQLPLPELEQTWANIWRNLQQWLEALPADDLRVVLPIRLPPGLNHFPRWQILRHSLDHSIFHRGQVVGMIRTLGYIPPAINRMDFFLLKSEAAAE